MIVTFENLQVGSYFFKHRSRHKLMRVIQKDTDYIKVELDGLNGQVFTLTKSQVNEGKYSCL